jgi:hypothetical protein
MLFCAVWSNHRNGIDAFLAVADGIRLLMIAVVNEGALYASLVPEFIIRDHSTLGA